MTSVRSQGQISRPEEGPVSGEPRRPRTVAEAVARFLVAQGVQRVYGLCGGHIQPIWDELVRQGLSIVDTRHEGAAVYMAQADAELTGRLGVALVTAGPGFTNTLTAMANAAVGGGAVLVLSGRPPRPQEGMGALQEFPQATMARQLCRHAEEVSHQRRVLPALATAVWTALGGDGPLGPAYVDFPTDLLREPLVDAAYDARWLTRRGPSALRPDPSSVAAAAALLTRSRRTVVVAGRVRHVPPKLLSRFLRETDAVFVAQSEARALLPAVGSAAVPGAKGQAFSEADLVVTLGCRLNFQLGYGSPAVLSPTAGLIRVGRSQDELVDNRPADVELQGDVAASLAAMMTLGVSPRDPDRGWRNYLRTMSTERAERLKAELGGAPAGSDGRMHPYRLLEAVAELVNPDDVVVADGGDILSFARVALPPASYLDSGAFGCLGVGVPFAIGAALAGGGKPVVCVTGDGALGFHAMELDTASRTGAPILVVVANNAAWNIERADQLSNWNGRIAGTELPGCRYDKLAKAVGVHGIRVDEAQDLRHALHDALEHLPALVDVAVTREADSPDFRSGLPSVPDHQALATWDKAERLLAGQSVAGGFPAPAS